MGFLDKAKAAAEQAASKAKETAGELQTKRELGQAYDELGRKAFELVESGAIVSAELDPLVEKVRTLKAQLDEREPVGATAGTTTTEPPASEGPPAMPT
jgi:acyl transferase domain-containing protein